MKLDIVEFQEYCEKHLQSAWIYDSVTHDRVGINYLQINTALTRCKVFPFSATIFFTNGHTDVTVRNVYYVLIKQISAESELITVKCGNVRTNKLSSIELIRKNINFH